MIITLEDLKTIKNEIGFQGVEIGIEFFKDDAEKANVLMRCQFTNGGKQHFIKIDFDEKQSELMHRRIFLHNIAQRMKNEILKVIHK